MSRLTTYLNSIFDEDVSCSAIWVEKYYEDADKWPVIDNLSDEECQVKLCTKCSWQKDNMKEIVDELSEPME